MMGKVWYREGGQKMNSLMNNSRKDRMLLFINKVLLIFIILITLVPLLYVLLGSFLQPDILLTQGFSLNPDHWTVDGYTRIFADGSIMRGFFNSILYATCFTILSVSIAILAGYSLSVDNLALKKPIMFFFLFTMFLSGGLIPTYLVVRSLGLLDTMWAVILPGALSVWNIILARTYFKGLPKELKEAAKIDGAYDIMII